MSQGSLWARRTTCDNHRQRRVMISRGTSDRHAQDAEAHAARHRPSQRHLYLGVVATHPDYRRRGLASRTLQPGLALATSAGIAAYLETSAPENVRSYENLGFKVTTHTPIPGGGPHLWTMQRPAAADSERLPR